MGVRFKFCPHLKTYEVARWRDTAGILWIEDACKECDRRWRWRNVLSYLGVRWG